MNSIHFNFELLLSLFFCPVAYHVDNNRDLFYKEILEGIFIILIGKVCSFEHALVIVGGNRKYYFNSMQETIELCEHL